MAMVTAPGFVSSIADFFQVSSLVICLSPNAEELTVGEHIVSNDQLVTFRHQEDILDALPASSSESVLIHCEGTFDSFRPEHFRSNVVWLVPTSSVLEVDLDRAPMRLDSNFLIYSLLSNQSILIDEKYGVKAEKTTDNYFGSWDEASGLIVPEPSTWERRNDFKGITLINTVNNWSPMVAQNEDGELWGLFPDILFLLQARLNFSLVTVNPEDGNWGSLVTHEDGSLSLNGMAGQLERGEVDICGATLTMTRQRMDFIDFTVGILEDVISITILNPSYSSAGGRDINLMVYITVFSSWTWLAILFTALAVAASCIFLEESDHEKSSGYFACRDKLKSFMGNFYKFFLALIQRSPDENHLQRLTSRTIFVVVSAISYILFNYYVSDLTATMTAGTGRVQLRSFADLLKADYVLYLIAGTAFEDIFKHATDPVMQELYSSSELLYSTETYASEFRQLAYQRSRIAVFTTPFSNIGYSDLLHLSDFEDAFVSQLAFPLQKDSEFKAAFDYHLIKLEQLGLMQQLRHQWIQGNQPNDMSHRIFQEDAAPLGFGNLFFPAMVLMIGIVSALMMNLVEKVRVWVDPGSRAGVQKSIRENDDGYLDSWMRTKIRFE